MMTLNLRSLVSTTLLCTVCAAQANDTPLQWGVSAGMNRYSEPQMRLQGPELGLHVRLNEPRLTAQLKLEGDVFLGSQHYSSSDTGTLDHVRNIETRWRGLTRVVPGVGATQGLSMGLGVHTLWNDLRGVTSTGNPGYERQATQLWLPMRWDSDNLWSLETGVLLRGRHTSRLSQTSAAYSDVHNIQKRGIYLQGSLDFPLQSGHIVNAYARYTHLSDSDTVVMGGKSWIEPNSQRWQIGLGWLWGTR